jgi:T-complex protein 1 subunit alpha
VEQGIDDVCMKYLVEAGVIGVRRCKKEDLRRIAAATGGTLLPNLADLEGGETFDAAHLGRAEEVSEEKVGDGTWYWNALYAESMVSFVVGVAMGCLCWL